MRHGRRMKKFGKDKAGRKALMRNLAKQLFIYGRIVTTVGRGKFLRGVVEPIITRAKGGTLNDIREIYKYIDDRDLVRKIVTEVAPLYKERHGGYTRVMRLKNRPGDNAEMAVMELIDYTKVYKKEEPKKKEEKTPKKEAAVKEVKEPKKEKPKKEEKAPKAEEKKEDKKKEKKEEKKEEKKKDDKKKDEHKKEEHKKEEHKKEDKKKDKK
jgi:large subunit ribosomal protein L17